MKKTLIGICLAMAAMMPLAMAAQSADEVEQPLFANMQGEDKAAVLAVHFGTSEASAHATISKFNDKLKAAYPNCDFREAWTSRIIIKKLAQQGKSILTPDQVMSELKKLGYTHVLIQSTNIIDGIEMQYLRYLAESEKSSFKQIRVGEPLLTTTDDYRQAIKATLAAYGKENEINILVCHGSKDAKNAHYTMLDYMLGDMGYSNAYVATIEGYPSLESVISKLNKDKKKKKMHVNLIPFLFVAGDHAKNDIAVDLPEELQKEGYKASATMHSIGELDTILDLIVSHAKHAEKYYTYSIKEHKMRSAVK